MIAVAIAAGFAQQKPAQPLPLFEGRKVTITEFGEEPPFEPVKFPAKICVESPPRQQCHTMPESYGAGSTVELVQLKKNAPALLFRSDTRGASGYLIGLALLRPGDTERLENLFGSEIRLTNQCEYRFWTIKSISDTPIFVTANYVWGRDEPHSGPHRYIISAYLFAPSGFGEGGNYDLQDSYMTVREYDQEVGPSVLDTERTEILTRLARVLKHAKSKR